MRVTLVELSVLDLKHNPDYIFGGRTESFHAYSCANNRNCLDGLPSELLVLRSAELSKIGDQELDSLLEVGNEIFANLLDDRAQGCRRILLAHRDSVLDDLAELL